MATYTPNLNLKKPDYTDLADVADFNANMDIIDGLTQDDIPDGTTNKVFTATEKNKLAGIEAGANKTTIVNNLTETVPGKALDATQGKVLAELVSTVSADLESHKAESVHQYETGTWTPILAGATTAGSHVYSAQQGKYTKIGNTIFFTGYIYLSDFDNVTSGAVRITGLPFTSKELTSVVISMLRGLNLNYSGDQRFLQGRINQFQNYIELQDYGDSLSFVDASRVSDDFRIVVSGTYIIYN